MGRRIFFSAENIRPYSTEVELGQMISFAVWFGSDRMLEDIMAYADSEWG